jgi:hypothetical protein
MKKFSSSTILFFAILMFAACSQGRSATPPADDDAIANLSGPVVECTKDEDCVVVEIGCCDHCNGGEVASVNVAYAEEVEEYHTGDCGDQIMCTMMACPDELPRCREGECEHYTDTSWLDGE